MDRRNFAKAAALLPLGFALTTVAVQQDALAEDGGEQEASKINDETAKPSHKNKTAAEYNKHPPINEIDPFARATMVRMAAVRSLLFE